MQLVSSNDAMLINALLCIKTSSHNKLTQGLATKASLLHALQTVYTFLSKLYIAKTQAFVAMNRTLGLSIRMQLLKKEQKRDINMLRNLWPPNKKGKKAKCVRGDRRHVRLTTLRHATLKVMRSL